MSLYPEDFDDSFVTHAAPPVPYPLIIIKRKIIKKKIIKKKNKKGSTILLGYVKTLECETYHKDQGRECKPIC